MNSLNYYNAMIMFTLIALIHIQRLMSGRETFTPHLFI